MTEDGPGLSASELQSGRKRETLGARMKRHALHMTRHPRDIISYVGWRVRSTARAWVRVRWEWLNYQIVHFHGRHANPISARLLPKNRQPGFWYASKRLGRSHVPRPFDGDVLAIFIDRHDRHAMWSPLLGPTAEVRIIKTGHSDLFSEPALSQWQQVLRARLDATP